MNKLIELLNEYAGHLHYYLNNGCICVIGGPVISDLEIISKSYGFIKWLVDNDKIDLKKASNIDNGPLFNYYYDEDALIMALSINDEPLNFLAFILK